MERMEQFVHTRVETHSIVLGSLLLALVLIAALVYWRNRRVQSGDTILLVGPSDGGKTAIFSSLVYNHAPQTHTSLQQNTALFRSPSPFASRALRIVDIPGHPRIRGQFADYLHPSKSSSSSSPSFSSSTSSSSSAKANIKLGGVKGVIFVCDAAALTRNSSTVAEHLHLIMSAITNLPPSITPPPLLVFANKSDLLPTPKPSAGAGAGAAADARTLALTRTQTILERELEKRRAAALSRGGATGSGVLSELGAEADGDDEGGLGGLDVNEQDAMFSFDSWEGGEVEVRSGWVDVKRGGAGGMAGRGGGEETDSDGEGEGEEKPRRGAGEKEGERKEVKRDGLVQLVEWIATLR